MRSVTLNPAACCASSTTGDQPRLTDKAIETPAHSITSSDRRSAHSLAVVHRIIPKGIESFLDTNPANIHPRDLSLPETLQVGASLGRRQAR